VQFLVHLHLIAQTIATIYTIKVEPIFIINSL